MIHDKKAILKHVLRALKFSVLKLIEIVILWVYYTIPFGFSLFRHFWAITFNFWIIIVWLRITDEGSLPEMRILFILLIEFDLNWCIHLSRSLFLYSSTLRYLWDSLFKLLEPIKRMFEQKPKENKKRLLLRCIHHFKTDLINNMDHMRISGTEPTLISDPLPNKVI